MIYDFIHVITISSELGIRHDRLIKKIVKEAEQLGLQDSILDSTYEKRGKFGPSKIVKAEAFWVIAAKMFNDDQNRRLCSVLFESLVYNRLPETELRYVLNWLDEYDQSGSVYYEAFREILDDVQKNGDQWRSKVNGQINELVSETGLTHKDIWGIVHFLFEFSLKEEMEDVLECSRNALVEFGVPITVVAKFSKLRLLQIYEDNRKHIETVLSHLQNHSSLTA